MADDIEVIYRMYFKDVYRYLLRLTHGNTHLSEELTQETFFKAMKNIHSFKGESQIYTWLCQIAKNSYYNTTRNMKRFDLDQDIETLESSQPSVEEMASNQEVLKQVSDIVEELDEPYKTVMYLRAYKDLSFKEIGTYCKKSESWARVTFHRAKIKIKEELL